MGEQLPSVTESQDQREIVPERAHDWITSTKSENEM